MRRPAFIFLIVAALLLVIAFDILVKAGAFVRVEPHFAGSCEQVPLPGSAEDIQIDRATGLAYLSVLDRRAVIEGRNVTGTILSVDLDARTLAAAEAVIDPPADFRPHGMSLYTAPDGAQRLLVISHPQGRPHTVEIFERTAEGAFAHIETLHNPLLVEPNAIVAVGPRQFYVANFSGAARGVERFAELYLGRALAEIVYFDGDVMRWVDQPIALGTGIAASADGGRVYVSEANAGRVRVYSRDTESGELALVEYVDINTIGDNLNVAEDGAIWVAAHPKPYRLLKHLQDASRMSPTQILRIAADPLAEKRVREIYLNAGDEISAGSVAAVSGKQLLIGSITDPKILVCSLP